MDIRLYGWGKSILIFLWNIFQRKTLYLLTFVQQASIVWSVIPTTAADRGTVPLEHIDGFAVAEYYTDMERTWWSALFLYNIVDFSLWWNWAIKGIQSSPNRCCSLSLNWTSLAEKMFKGSPHHEHDFHIRGQSYGFQHHQGATWPRTVHKSIISAARFLLKILYLLIRETWTDEILEIWYISGRW